MTKETISKSIIILITLFHIIGCTSIEVEQSLNVRNVVSDDKKNSHKKFTKNIKKIAVVPIPHKYVSDRHLEAVFTDGIQNKGYIVTSRSDIPSIQREQAFQRSGLTSGTAAKIGKILKADAVLIIDVTQYSKTRSTQGNYFISNLSLSAKLIDVETANIIWIETKSYRPSLIGMFASTLQELLVGNNSEVDQLAIGILEQFPRKN